MYEQIVERLRDSIQSRQLADNLRLPTNRELAAMLKVDRSTVSRAYFELEQQGLIESHVGRGTFVRVRSGAAQEARTTEPVQSMVWPEKFSRASQTAFGILGRQPAQGALATNSISFAGGIPSEEFYPQEEFRRIVSQLARNDRSAEMFGYSPAEGDLELRRQVKCFLTEQRIPADDNELLIVSGSQQAIDLVTTTLVDPGDVVFVEEPTYFWAILKFAASQARCLPIPVDEHGIKVDVLESMLSRHQAKLLYLMPTFQNPTGATLSLDRRHKLLEVSRRYQIAILEDNFVGDLRYDGQPLPSLKALDRDRDLVIHQGTFSKALCPGLRLGWLVAPAEVSSRLQLAKRASDLSTNSMAQVVMAEYLRQGLYEKHLEHVKSVYRRRRDTMCQALSTHLGSRLSWTKPEGGLFVWAKLPSGCSSRELLAHAEREGVSFSPGDMFFVHGDRMDFLRLSFIQHDEQTIETGISRLGRAVDLYLQSRQRLERSSNLVHSRGNESALI